MEMDTITVQDIFVFERQGVDPKGKVRGRYRPTGIRPKFSEKLLTLGIEYGSDAFFEVFLQHAAVKMPVSTLLSIAAGDVFVTALVTFVMYMPLPAVLGLTAVAGVIPFWVVSFKRKRRFSAFQEQFPDAIEMLARAVR